MSYRHLAVNKDFLISTDERFTALYITASNRFEIEYGRARIDESIIDAHATVVSLDDRVLNQLSMLTTPKLAGHLPTDHFGNPEVIAQDATIVYDFDGRILITPQLQLGDERPDTAISVDFVSFASAVRGAQQQAVA